MNWTKQIPAEEIKEKVTRATVAFAEEFGHYLGTDETDINPKSGRPTVTKAHLNSAQLRKFFGEVKRQQMQGYDETQFILLKPKLAYAVARADKNSKIKDFYTVMAAAIDLVTDSKTFNNFIQVFEAIVAYHKAAEEKKM